MYCKMEFSLLSESDSAGLYRFAITIEFIFLVLFICFITLAFIFFQNSDMFWKPTVAIQG